MMDANSDRLYDDVVLYTVVYPYSIPIPINWHTLNMHALRFDNSTDLVLFDKRTVTIKYWSKKAKDFSDESETIEITGLTARHQIVGVAQGDFNYGMC